MSKKKLKIKPNLKSDILSLTIAYVREVFEDHSEVPVFHDFPHIKEVVKVVDQLSDAHELSKGKKEVVLLAAWLYFLGIKEGKGNFKPASQKRARIFLEGHNYEKTDAVCGLIGSRLKNSDKLEAQILHDALVSYKGRKRFFRKVELLRLERESVLQKRYTDYTWAKMMYRHLIFGTFLTDAAKQKYRTNKIKNIKKQRSNIKNAHKVTTRKKTGKEFGRGVDTLYRANYNNHISLSSIADGKANMMISINTIILSVIVTLSGAGFTFSGTFMVNHLRFTIPIFILLIGSLASVVFAVISARPKVTTQKIPIKEVDEKQTSLLFFGNFLQVSLDDFINHLARLKKNQRRLYDSMSIDLYHLGGVLQIKYKLLTYSYNAFMIGLVAGVFAFVAIFIYTNNV